MNELRFKFRIYYKYSKLTVEMSVTELFSKKRTYMAIATRDPERCIAEGLSNRDKQLLIEQWFRKYYSPQEEGNHDS